MATSQVQILLRFLSQDAKVPLTTALGKVNDLMKADLATPETISKGDFKLLQGVFKDDKVAKQVLNAAKRVSKKRSGPTESNTESPQKRTKVSSKVDTTTPFATENSLALPVLSASEEELSDVVLLTNRAPLVLAFAVCVLKYTMPEQPISSRLSLAQAVVSANSRTKAVSLGIESGTSADSEGWGEGQPTVSVLGRSIKVLKRWDYNPREGQTEEPQEGVSTSDDVLGQRSPRDSEPAPPLWGIDTEALKKAQSTSSKPAANADKALPIHAPQSARAYILKAFLPFDKDDTIEPDSTRKKGQTHVERTKETCLGQLLRSIDLVCQSWASTLSADELDRRAWSWYVRVRPSVQSGRGGWGEKGAVELSEILDLKRELFDKE
ncbi:uncharacterized protein BDV14DRAFT_165166 [Aspergillus stella-maris]|uniref:uncharacterized protein n=1 Tax=Aspergillus stella-maris TaxID=1810926 RepID=UPI003CCD26CF